MSSNILRQEVLRSFKNLHRASALVFKNNQTVLEGARKEINEGFKKNKKVTDVNAIKELIKFADEVRIELKTTVVEVEETEAGTYRLNIRPDMFEECEKAQVERNKK